MKNGKWKVKKMTLAFSNFHYRYNYCYDMRSLCPSLEFCLNTRVISLLRFSFCATHESINVLTTLSGIIAQHTYLVITIMRSTKVRLSINRFGAKTSWGMKTETVPWDVGLKWGWREGWLKHVREGKGRRKTCFSAGYTRFTVYVHYFKDIRQGAL